MSPALLILGIFFFATALFGYCLFAGGAAAWGRYRANFTEAARANLSRLFLFVDARKIFVYNAVAVAVVPVAVYLVTGVAFFALVMGVVLFALPKILFRALHRRRLRHFEHQLPDGLNMMAGAMRAGASLPLAIEAMVRETQPPINQEFALVLREQRMGVSLDEAFENLAGRVPSADLGLVVAAARIARDVGGNLSEIFNRLADTLRQKAAMEGKIRALTSQGKLQGWIVGLLPFGMIGVLYQLEPLAMLPLFTTALGWAVLAVIALMQLFGALVIRKIVSIDV